jgi:hypothetical protein
MPRTGKAKTDEIVKEYDKKKGEQEHWDKTQIKKTARNT